MNTRIYGPLFDKNLSSGVESRHAGPANVTAEQPGVPSSGGSVPPAHLSGTGLRDQGLSQVSEHNENWMYHAFRSARCFVMTSKYDFTGEDIRFHCLGRAGDPSTPHAWGALINTLIKRKIIVPTGEHRKMRDSRSHARSTPVYKAG